MATHKHLVVLTGAGISAESGLKTFRDTDGLWNGYRVEEVATPGGWAKNQEMVLEFYNMRRREMINAQPNAAHLGLVALEQHFRVTIITQNVDDLHERAGSSTVIHLHGEIMKMRSTLNEHLIYPVITDIKKGDKAGDGAQLRPHIVWFEEPVPLIEDAADICTTADIFAVIGTSLQVYPAAGLLQYPPENCLRFIIDKNIPDLGNFGNLIPIALPATEGVPILMAQLLAKYL